MLNPERPRPARTVRSNLLRVAAVLALAGSSAAGCAFGTSEDDRADVDTRSTGVEDGDPGAGDKSAASAPEDSEETEEPAGALLLVMDASGSMNEVDSDGQPLIDGAKQALHGVVDALPDGTHVGLRVYGHRVANTDEQNGCRDTELIAPVGPLDRDALNDTIDGYEAVGFTPIGLSLQQAVDDLPPEGPRTILLVSDGEDTCAPPDPCDVAADVRAGGVELVIHTVGFALPDDASRQQLECIAEAGGGEFHDAGTAAELATTLEDVSEREARRYETSGDALEGAPIPRDAETGEVDTAHVDTVMGGEVNYYRFEIEPGSEVRGEVIITGNPDADRFHCPGVWLTDEGDESYAYAPGPGGTGDETFVKHTDPAVVEADEVWLKVESDTCSSVGDGPIGFAFDIELQLTVVD